MQTAAMDPFALDVNVMEWRPGMPEKIEASRFRLDASYLAD